MMTMREEAELRPMLKKLKLSGVLETLSLRVREAGEDNLDLMEFLYRVLHDEVQRREGKQLLQRVRRAGFEHERTLEDFDFTFNPSIPKARLIELATTRFVARAENVLLIGPTGVGKSHLAHALGQRACRAGHDVLFVTAERMLGALRAARADESYERVVRRFVRPALLIVDDLGLRSLTGNEPLDLYDVVRQRYEKGSLIVTSNRDVRELYPLFGEELLASAAMDRLLHHAHVLELEGSSYRTPGRRQE